MTARARIIRAQTDVAPEPLASPWDGKRARRVVLEELQGRADAERILQEARDRAATLIARARRDAEHAGAAALREAHERADTELAARWLALRQQEHCKMEQDLDRVVSLATALAERLFGAALALAPDLVVGLARGVLSEARGARRAKISAHPLDAALLREELTASGLDLQSFEVESDGGLARGELRLHTDIGNIDARLAPRFQRLSAALRDALT